MISLQDLDKYKTGMQDQIAIRTFVDKLIEERKDPEVTPEKLPLIRTMLIKKVNEAINEHFVSLLNDEDVLELDKLLDAKVDDAGLNDFFRKKVPNVSVEIATALLTFRAAYLYPVWKKQQEEIAAKQPVSSPTEAPDSSDSLDSLPPAPVM